jgi:hypothetical protein
MSLDDANYHKRKTPDTAETVSSTDDQNQNIARKESTDISASTMVATENSITATFIQDLGKKVAADNAITTADTASTMEDEDLVKILQDLFRSDTAKVNVKGLDEAFMKDKKNRAKFVAAGGCRVLVQLVKDCLKKAKEEIPACYQVTNLCPIPELKSLYKTLSVITKLTFHYDESTTFGFTFYGGVEALIKVMKTFSKCQKLQDRAAGALVNLVSCSNVTGIAIAIKSGGIQVLLAAINNHLSSAIICEYACVGLLNIVVGSKENTGRLTTLGGEAAVLKVRTKWPDSNDVQAQVYKLSCIFEAGWKDRRSQEEKRRK